MWNLNEGILVARQLEVIAVKHNLHVALGGGVLLKGTSDKDLDIFVFKHKTSMIVNYDLFKQDCIDFGLTLWEERDHTNCGDNKEVYKTDYNGKRIDIFLL